MRTIASMEAKAEEARRAEYLGRLNEALDAVMGAAEDVTWIGECFIGMPDFERAAKRLKVQLVHRLAPPPDRAS